MVREKMVTVKIKKKKGAKIPRKAYESDACFDLHSNENCVIEPNRKKMIGTGIFLEIPDGYEGVVRPRSGFSYDNETIVLNSPGTIDSSYRGEVKIIMKNLGNRNVFIKKGDRIAQIGFREIPHVNIEEVKEVNDTDRGEGGFGSTGK